jgi:hypothetical protein
MQEEESNIERKEKGKSLSGQSLALNTWHLEVVKKKKKNRK